MDKIRLRIHPLFILFGVVYAATGQVFAFLVFTVTALLHELGHSFAAARRGYRLSKITLMPYGAVISGETDMTKRDEIIIAIAGPATNFAIALFFVAVWWLYPPIYPYTELAVTANLGLCAINLFPAFPLDGGRVLYAFLRQRLKGRTPEKVCFIASLAFSALSLAAFFVSIAVKINLSLLFFALFMVFGAFGIKGENKYVKIACGGGLKRLKKGVEIKRIAVSEDITLQRLLTMLSDDYLYEISVYGKNMKKRGEITQGKLNSLLSEYPLSSTLASVMGRLL